LKNQVISRSQGSDIVDVVAGQEGPKSDISIWREHREKFAEEQQFIGDKAYLGEQQIKTPMKKPKGGELSEQQIRENQELSRARIGVEHLIRRLKIFRVVSEKFRLSRECYEEIILTVCGLVRINLGSSPIVGSGRDKLVGSGPI
jgi:hypothetical protein